MKLTIATPMYGGQCTGIFTKSLLHAANALAQEGISLSFLDIYNESLITRARNTLTHAFMQSDSDYLLFIDADQSFNANDIIRMIRHDKDIVAATVPMKAINWANVKKAAELGKDNLPMYTGIFNVNLLKPFEKDEKVTVSDPVEVLYAGSGMMLIKRGVFEKLSDLVNSYKYDGSPIPGFGLEHGTMVKDYWFTSVVDDRLLSEDYNLCSLWRNQGGKVYVDLLARVVHVGTYHFSGTLIDPSTVAVDNTKE